MRKMKEQYGVEHPRWRDETLRRFEEAWEKVVAEKSASDAGFKRIADSYFAFRETYRIWGEAQAMKATYLDDEEPAAPSTTLFPLFVAKDDVRGPSGICADHEPLRRAGDGHHPRDGRCREVCRRGRGPAFARCVADAALQLQRPRGWQQRQGPHREYRRRFRQLATGDCLGARHRCPGVRSNNGRIRHEHAAARRGDRRGVHALPRSHLQSRQERESAEQPSTHQPREYRSRT